MKACDALIIGGGLVGLMTARELNAAGLEVRLLDRSVAPRAASWAGGGILSPLQPWREPVAVLDLCEWSQTVYAGLTAELHAQTGIDPGYRPDGMLILEPSDTAIIRDWSRHRRQSIEFMARRELELAEPAIAPCFQSAVRLADVAQVRNPRLLRAMIRLLEQRGVSLEYGVNVERLLVRSDRCVGVVADGEEQGAGHVILCAGAWSASLLPGLPAAPPLLRPIKGQMLAFRLPPGRLRHMLLHDLRYLIPRDDGLILAGSTVEDTGFDTAVTAAAAAELRAHAGRLLPELAVHEPLLHWTGLRPATPDSIPLIGRHPGIGSLFLNTGHFRNGILLAPASARLLADLLLGRRPLLRPEPYDPGRFPGDTK